MLSLCLLFSLHSAGQGSLFLHVQVFLNQTALAPVVCGVNVHTRHHSYLSGAYAGRARAATLCAQVLSVVFAWNMVLTGQASKVTGKIKLDLVPTMVNGAPA